MTTGAQTVNFFAKSEFFDYNVFGALGPWGPGTLGPRGPGAQGPWGTGTLAHRDPGAQGPWGPGVKVLNVLLENFFARVAFLRIFSTNYLLPRPYHAYIMLNN